MPHTQHLLLTLDILILGARPSQRCIVCLQPGAVTVRGTTALKDCSVAFEAVQLTDLNCFQVETELLLLRRFPFPLNLQLRDSQAGRRNHRLVLHLLSTLALSSSLFCLAFWSPRSIWLNSHQRLGAGRPGQALSAPASCEPGTPPSFLSRSPSWALSLPIPRGLAWAGTGVLLGLPGQTRALPLISCGTFTEQVP